MTKNKPVFFQYTIKDLQQIRSSFLDELLKAERGEQTRFAYAKHTISHQEMSSADRCQVVVIGGTNCVIALAESAGETIQIIDQVNLELPVIHSSDILFSFLADHLDVDVSMLALNFAYPLEACYRNGKLDGRLIKATKEHSFKGLIGEMIGEQLEKYILDKQKRAIDVVTANDTVCLVLSGRGLNTPKRLVAGIVGTGFNFGFYLDDHTIVNLESGNFDNFTRTDSCRYLDQMSNNPGEQLWEKEVAGAYLPLHYNYYLHESGNNAQEISNAESVTQLAQGEGAEAYIANQLLMRSASLVACEIAAISDFKKAAPLTIVIEGALFWKGWQYSDYVWSTLGELGFDHNQINICSIENSSVIGGAHLVL